MENDMAGIFLTDEFVAFSKNIADLHERKKAAIAEFTPIYEAFKKQTETFDEEYKGLVASWENWKALNEPKKSSTTVKVKDE